MTAVQRQLSQPQGLDLEMHDEVLAVPCVSTPREYPHSTPSQYYPPLTRAPKSVRQIDAAEQPVGSLCWHP